VLDFPAAFDKPTAERLETIAQQSAKKNGIDRRIALALLTRSSAELRQSTAENSEAAEALLSCAESLRGAIEWLEGQIKLLRTAEMRILAVLSDAYPEAVEGEQSGEAGEPVAHSGE
jgi:hypothetical protein